MVCEESNSVMTAASGSDGPTECKQEHGRSITATEALSLLELQGYRCALTGVELTPQTATGDHAIPLKRGGSNTMDNIIIIRADVNQAKGTQTVGEFIRMCREVVEHADSK